MFCHKCGAQMVEGAAFCPKCGTKVAHTDDIQQPMDTTTSAVESQQTDTMGATITENTQCPPGANKAKGGMRKAASIGRVLAFGCPMLLLLSSFVRLPISPVVLAAGTAIGLILSAIGAKRPLGFSKIMELVSAVILLVVIGFYVISSGGGGDKYIQMVKSGTLNGYPQMTVGEAFDGFLENPKWESGLSDDNVRFVNVTGGALYNDEEVELAVQFIVDEKTGSFEYNACEVDGTPQNNLVFWGLLETVYEDTGSVNNTSQPTSDYLTYTNEVEGISFRYPGFWEEGSLSESGVYFSDDSMTMIVYLLAPTVDGPKQPILNIRKAPVTQDVINEIFAATLSDIMPEGNMMAAEIEDVAIGDLPGRRFTFVTKTNSGSDATYIRYIYFVNSYQYRIEFIGTTESMESEDIKGYIDDVMSSYIVTAPEPDISVDPSTVSPTTPNSIDIGGGVTIFAGGPYGLSEVSSLLGTSVDSIMNDWGTPLEYEAGAGVDYCIYDGITFNFDADGVIYTIDLDPSKCVTKAETLDKTREALLDILGTPTEEGYEPAGYTDMYRMRYEDFMDGMGFVIEMTSPDDVASSMRIWQN